MPFWIWLKLSGVHKSNKEHPFRPITDVEHGKEKSYFGFGQKEFAAKKMMLSQPATGLTKSDSNHAGENSYFS